MRERRLVPVVVVSMSLLSLVSTLAACSGQAPRPATAESAAPSTPQVQAQAPSRLKLVEGDTFRIALRANAVIGMATLPGGLPLAQTSFSSSNPLVATIVDGAIVARDSGIATVTATAVGAPGVSKSMVVEVMTPAQAVNEMVVEVCPNTSDAPFVRISRPLTEQHARIHEFHDCQRLIEGTAYSALVGIFAHRNVAQYEDWNDYRDGRLVATIVNFVGDKTAQRYAPLDIPPGTSCLYLRATSESAWQAALVPQAGRVLEGTSRTYDSCVESRRPELSRTPWGVLEVKLQYGVDMNGDSIAPPVARWDWDEANRHNYMGVKCGRNRWCEIGRRGFVPSPPIRVNTPLVGQANVIKGYYDQQYLASADGRSPTTVLGTIVPDEDIKKHGKMKHYQEKWYEVAEITLQEKAGDKTPEYRRYVRQYAGLPWFDFMLGKTRQAELGLRPDLTTGDLLRLYVGRLNGKALLDGGVVFHYHAGSGHGPPTVRWRWHHDDERTWSYCDPEGCCETARLLTDN